MSSRLFKPLKIGNIQLEHRIAFAPLTRLRADANHVPSPLAAEYYSQRASTPGTLLITEASFIAAQAGGFPNVPGIWSEEQINEWKKITDSVHSKGSFIYLQLWAMGRAAYEELLKAELGPSAVVKGSSNIPNKEGGTVPVPLTEEEISEYIELYAQGAKNAISAGFDGVEIHGANGCLVDQFIQDVSNQRLDKWGGSIENRARFAIEVVNAVIGVVGADRTAIRLSPYSRFNGMGMQDPAPQFRYVLQELKKLKLAYLHLIKPRISGDSEDDAESGESIDYLIDIWRSTSPVLVAGGLTPGLAAKTTNEEYEGKDVVLVFGRHFIANPDLVFKVRNGLQLTPYDRNTFYTSGAEGYTTYPFSQEFETQGQAER